ncbi:MAG: outer membrane beta-barrel protein [Opitutaceae bacterium]|nr:outer membrane beta-barrel protein [Opitutaceae bacterium]
MTAASHIGRVLAMMTVAAAMSPRADALLELNDGHDKVTVSAEYGITYDSNLFVQAGGGGDYNQSLALGINYTRRAGLIGVNASVSVSTARFTKFTGENFTNPAFNLGLTKAQGRLTGSVGITAQRESRSDVAANLRADSWNFGSTLTLRYPINERYYFTSGSEFSLQDYVQQGPLFNLSSYSEAIDVFYVYTSKLDLLGGYRIRLGDAAGGSHTQDHALTFGATGGILPKLNGSVRVGYQWRNESSNTGGRYDSLTSSLSLAWPVTKRVTFNYAVSKDFTTAATDVSVDVTAFSLSTSLKPALRLKLVLDAGIGYSISDYLGIRGDGRQDKAVSLNASVSFPFTAIISTSLSYVYTDNHSNIAFSNFARHTATFSLSARY